MLAAQQRVAIGTRAGDQEFLVWDHAPGGVHLTCVDTSVTHWKAEIAIRTQNSSGRGGTVPFVHHPALRFYRLSQMSADLFDAFRNAYLALEVLISDVSPKRRAESELAWLKRVVRESFYDAIPGGIDPGSSLDVWYRIGRNRIFHAKMGETFYAPLEHGREEIQLLFEQLTIFLASLLQHRLGPSHVSRWGSLSQQAQDAQARALFASDEVVLRGLSGAARFSAALSVHESPRRFGQLWASLTVSPEEGLPDLVEIELRKLGQEWACITFAEPLSLEGVTRVSLELNHVHSHVGAPKLVHPR